MRVFTRISLALTLLLISTFSFAQTKYSVIRMFNQTYTSLAGGETLAFDENTSSVEFTMPNGSIRLFDREYTTGGTNTVEIALAGTFVFLDGEHKTRVYGNTTSMGIRDENTKVVFLEEGDYYKFEFINVGYMSPNASADDYTNFQVWFNKTNDEVEYHFGTSHHEDIVNAHGGASGPLIGMIEYDGANFANLALLQGPPNLCQAQDNFGTMNGVAAEGTVYILRNLKLSVYQVNAVTAKVYPNPVVNQLTVDLTDVNQAEVEVYDILGNKVLTTSITGGSNTLDVSALKAGQYIIRVSSNESVSNIRFNKL